MKKSLLTLTLLGTLSFGGKICAQSNEAIPEAVLNKAKESLNYVIKYCNPSSFVGVEKFTEKTGDFNGDGFVDNITIYKIKNVCEGWLVPNYLASVKKGTKEGYGKPELFEIISKDKNDKDVPLKEDYINPDWFD